MTVIQQYNALPTYNKVSRNRIEKLIDDAKEANISIVVDKLTKLLNQLPDTEFFSIEITNPLPETQTQPNGLAKPAPGNRIAFSRPKNKFKTAKDAWRSVAEETGAMPKFAKPNHNKTQWIWELEKFNIKSGLSGSKKQREGLNTCGYLEKGYKFEKGGKIVKTTPKAKIEKPKPATKPKVEKPKIQTPAAPDNSEIKILKTSPKGAMLITDGVKTVWIMKRGQRPDGSFTPGSIQKLKQSETTLKEFEKTGKTSNVVAAHEVRFESIVKETDKALLIRSFNGEEDWLPKAAILGTGNSTKSDSLFVAAWALKGKNLQRRNKVKFFPRPSGLNMPGQNQIFAVAKDGNNFSAAAPGYFDDEFLTEKQVEKHQNSNKISLELQGILILIKDAISLAKSVGLAGSWHARNTVQFFALDDCGRLRPGYLYEKGGKIVKVKRKKVKRKTTKKTIKKNDKNISSDKPKVKGNTDKISDYKKDGNYNFEMISPMFRANLTPPKPIKVDYTNIEQVEKILKKFLTLDTALKFQGVYHSKDGIVATDTHKLIWIKNEGKKDNIIYRGIQKSDAKYPNFKAVIPKNNEHKVEVNLIELYEFLKFIQIFEKNKVNFSLFKTKLYTFNPRLLFEVIETLIKLGNTKAIFEINESRNKAILIKSNKSKIISILMPIFSDSDNVEKNAVIALDGNDIILQPFIFNFIFDFKYGLLDSYGNKIDFKPINLSEKEKKLIENINKIKKTTKQKFIHDNVFFVENNKISRFFEKTKFVTNSFGLNNGVYLFLGNKSLLQVNDDYPTAELLKDFLKDIPETIGLSNPNQAVLFDSKLESKALNIITGEELLDINFDTLPQIGQFSEVLKSPPKNIRIGVYGLPKNGKTSGCTELAKEFAKTGKVLYNFADQGISKSTKDIWINSGLSDVNNVHLTGTQDIDELTKIIKQGRYNFVFIDMINNYIAKIKIKPHEFKEKILNQFPDVAFVLIMETTKTGNFKGDQAWMHIVDQIFEVKDFVIHSSGRYGFGHLILWPEGLERKNPKKFAELIEEPEPEISTEEVII